jgi:hypothetical protein
MFKSRSGALISLVSGEAMKRRLILILVFSGAAGAGVLAASGSLSDTYSKAALLTIQAIETDISTTEQASKAIFDPLNAAAKADAEKSMTAVLHQVYEQKLIDNRLRQAEFNVLDEALASPDPLIRDYISKEQISQNDRDEGEMSRREAACFEALKKNIQNHVSDHPKPCADWDALAAPAPKPQAGASEE